MTNENLARRRELLASTDPERKEERARALIETMLLATNGEGFGQKLAARDLADIGIKVQGACRAVA